MPPLPLVTLPLPLAMPPLPRRTPPLLRPRLRLRPRPSKTFRSY